MQHKERSSHLTKSLVLHCAPLHRPTLGAGKLETAPTSDKKVSLLVQPLLCCRNQLSNRDQELTQKSAGYRHEIVAIELKYFVFYSENNSTA